MGGRTPLDESFTVFSLVSPAFYAQCFDVDATDVTARVAAALWPFRPPVPFLSLIASKPDLYGPVWLAATLVFVIGAGSNLASWLSFSGGSVGASAAVSLWHYDFKALTTALVFVFGYSFGAPAAVWAAMAYLMPRGLGLGLVTLTCVYGYSVAPFIPAAVRSGGGGGGGVLHCVRENSEFWHARLPPPPLSQLLCVIPSGVLHWVVVLCATIISAAFTLQSTYRAVLAAIATAATERNAAATAAGARTLLAAIVCGQLAFGVVLKLFFFTFTVAA